MKTRIEEETRYINRNTFICEGCGKSIVKQRCYFIPLKYLVGIVDKRISSNYFCEECFRNIAKPYTELRDAIQRLKKVALR